MFEFFLPPLIGAIILSVILFFILAIFKRRNLQIATLIIVSMVAFFIMIGVISFLNSP